MPSPMTHDRRLMSEQESATRRAARFHRELHQPSPSRHSRPSTSPQATLRGALFPPDDNDDNQVAPSKPASRRFALQASQSKIQYL